MKKELELKHFLAYTEHNLMLFLDNCCSAGLEGVDLCVPNTIIAERINVNYKIGDVKLVLKPLKEMYNIPEIMDEFSEYSLENFETRFFMFGDTALDKFDHVDVTLMNLMCKYHLDIFQLLPHGLAITKDEVKNKLGL